MKSAIPIGIVGGTLIELYHQQLLDGLKDCLEYYEYR